MFGREFSKDFFSLSRQQDVDFAVVFLVLRAAQEVAAQTVKPARVARERKPLPPLDSAPMQQVETGQHPQ